MFRHLRPTTLFALILPTLLACSASEPSCPAITTDLGRPASFARPVFSEALYGGEVIGNNAPGSVAGKLALVGADPQQFDQACFLKLLESSFRVVGELPEIALQIHRSNAFELVDDARYVSVADNAYEWQSVSDRITDNVMYVRREGTSIWMYYYLGQYNDGATFLNKVDGTEIYQARNGFYLRRGDRMKWLYISCSGNIPFTAPEPLRHVGFVTHPVYSLFFTQRDGRTGYAYYAIDLETERVYQLEHTVGEYLRKQVAGE